VGSDVSTSQHASGGGLGDERADMSCELR